MITSFVGVFRSKRSQLQKSIERLLERDPGHFLLPRLSAELAELSSIISTLENMNHMTAKEDIDQAGLAARILDPEVKEPEITMQAQVARQIT